MEGSWDFFKNQGNHDLRIWSNPILFIEDATIMRNTFMGKNRAFTRER